MSEMSKELVASRILGAVGLASRAGKCAFGTEICVDMMRAGKGKLLLVASDISDNSHKKLVKTATYHKTPYMLTELCMSEISHAAGKKSNSAAILLTDSGFVKIIEKLGVKIYTTDMEVLD